MTFFGCQLVYIELFKSDFVDISLLFYAKNCEEGLNSKLVSKTTLVMVSKKTLSLS